MAKWFTSIISRRSMILASGAVVGGVHAFETREKDESNILIGQDDSLWSHAIGRADTVVQKFKEERGCPGIAVAVSVNGKVVWREGYGYSNVENLTPCDSRSVMRIASVSKPITAALLAKLLDEQKVDLDAPVQKYVPSFPEKTVDGEKVTLTTRHLVSHLGGIRHYNHKLVTNNNDNNKNQQNSTSNDDSTKVSLCSKCKEKLGPPVVLEFDKDEYYKHYKTYNSVIEALDVFKDDPLLHKPGTKYLYTTYGWTLVSAVIEGASGQKFEKLLKQMLDQFGMTETYLDENYPLISKRATYYTRDKLSGRLTNVRWVNNSYKWAGGGLLSNVDDLLKFAHVLTYSFACGTGPHRDPVTCPIDAYLSKDTVNLLWTPAEMTEHQSESCPHYGMGWCINSNSWPKYLSTALDTRSTSDTLVVSHGGGAVGACSYLLIKLGGKMPPTNQQTAVSNNNDRTIAVAILTNLQEVGGLNPLATKIARIFDESD